MFNHSGGQFQNKMKSAIKRQGAAFLCVTDRDYIFILIEPFREAFNKKNTFLWQMSNLPHVRRMSMMFFELVGVQEHYSSTQDNPLVQWKCVTKSNTCGFWTFWTSKLTNFKTRLWTRGTCILKAPVDSPWVVDDVRHRNFSIFY